MVLIRALLVVSTSVGYDADLRLLIREHADPETRLASGGKLRLSEVGQYELELVPQISEALAQRILSHREFLISRARALPRAQRSSVLGLVSGVGEKRAKSFGAYLEVE